jgi:hypothetical protein
MLPGCTGRDHSAGKGAKMFVEMQKASLSLQTKRLIETMQAIGFGRIEGLVIRDREPDFDSIRRIVREVKFGGENGPRPDLEHKNFTLKGCVIELISEFDHLEDGTEVNLEVKHGLPFKMEVEDLIRT